jgi:hypothetical protein
MSNSALKAGAAFAAASTFLLDISGVAALRQTP